MNLQQLRYAVEVAKTGSITAAAKNLYMGQPNLSKSIRELDIRAKHHVNVIAVRGPEGVLDVAPGGDYRLVQGGRIVVLGRTEYINLLHSL